MSDVSDLTGYVSAGRQILVFTGAGISTGSGIPDFRGPGGVWSKRKPVYFQDFMASEAARVEYWEYKLEGWPAMAAARPNAVHAAVVRLEQAGKVEKVVTQNIDGLHSLAGTSADFLVEVHGTNSLVECVQCHRRSEPGPHFEFFATHRTTPLCACGGYLKMATISFGQDLDPKTMERAYDAASKADLVVALGSTLSVYPAASIPLTAAKRGVPYVIVNRGATEHDGEACVSLRIEGDVGAVFPAAVDMALGT
ncbi:MAG: NAD-dependent deacetylase [Candidatus Hydrogenedentes bacterium]|nr:NAD-dependent deacetylase [Candidatus Hydrogenedentota bacterium]